MNILNPIIYHVPIIIGDSDEYYTYYIGNLINKQNLGVPIGKSAYARKALEPNMSLPTSPNWFVATHINDFNQGLYSFLENSMHTSICPDNIEGYLTPEEALSQLNVYLEKTGRQKKSPVIN